VLLEAQTHSLEELGRDLVQIGDDTCVEERLLLGRTHLLEFGGSHDLPGHHSILSLEHVSASRPRGVPVAFSQIVESTSGLSGTALGPRCGAGYPSASGLWSARSVRLQLMQRRSECRLRAGPARRFE
jgi:hypothetical protein